MFERIATGFVVALELYAAAGFLFALVFISIGVQRIDPEARGAGVGFRLIILPASVALWPYLLRRWLSGVAEPPIERNPHR
jgi:hypothetical protein